MFTHKKKHIIIINSDFKNHNHHLRHLKTKCPDARIRGISLGWVDGNTFTLQKTVAKTTSMPVGGDHCIAKYKTVPLQIYGNNVTGAKGCHFESKKAHFSVALLASDVKANYTPTC